MNRFLPLLAIVCHVFHAGAAVEMRLDLDEKTIPGGSSTCGIVRCLEDSKSPQVEKISSMTVFKTETGPPRRRRTSVASVSPRQPSVSRLWDGVKVDGTWSERKAEITLYLLEADDCRRAEFSCLVRAVDALGYERVSSSQLGSSGALPAAVDVSTHQGGAEGSTMPSARSVLQFSTIVQNTFASLESKLSQMQHRMDDSGRDLENRLEDKIDKLSEAVIRLESKNSISPLNSHDDSRTFSAALAGKMDQMSSRLTSMETKLARLQTSVENILHKTSLAENCSVSSSSFLDDQAKSILVHSNRSLSEIQESVLDSLSKTKTAIIEQIKSATGPGSEHRTSCERNDATQPTVKGYHVTYPTDDGVPQVPYLCDAMTGGGGWIVIQRRNTGNVDFFQDWDSYKWGFGSLDGEFWLGNEKIHTLTSQGPYELIVSLEYQGKSKFARYDSFSIGDESTHYKLSLGKHSGTAGDSLSYHQNMAFSTFDRDHDTGKSRNCAEDFTGAWWYGDCHNSNLNGVWGSGNNKGPRWASVSGIHPVTFSEMKIRRLAAESTINGR